MEHRLAIIGLGYGGLPLAVEFGKFFPTLGFDVNATRIAKLQKHRDRTREISMEEFRPARRLAFTTNLRDLRVCNTYIVTIPTHIGCYNRPDISLLLKASETVGSVLEKGYIVIYESTVYPGCTEEDCVPVLEKTSGLMFNQDFFCCYSPERVNPDDKTHRLPQIRKVTSGSTPEVAETVDSLYKTIIQAGTH